MKDNIIVIGNWIFIKIEISEKFCNNAEDKYMACGRYGGLMPEHIYTKKELLERSPDAIILAGINPSNTIVTIDK
jgi:hypothetical protein